MATALRSRRWEGGVDGDKASKGESKQRRPPEATAAAGSDWYTSQPWSRHSHGLSHYFFSLTVGPDLPLWPGWQQKLWHYPLSWALLPQRRAHIIQCARDCWCGRGESEPLKHDWCPQPDTLACLTCTCAHKCYTNVYALSLTLSFFLSCPPNPDSTPFPLIQIKSFQTQISIIHLIQIMPCDKNYPYCNNPLNWERVAHQKEKGEKGLEVRVVVVVVVTCQPVSNQAPHNKNIFPFWGGSLEAHWDDEIEVNWKKAWENAPTINNPRIKLALAWRDDGGGWRVNSGEWHWDMLVEQYSQPGCCAHTRTVNVYVMCSIPLGNETFLVIIVVITWAKHFLCTLYTSLKSISKLSSTQLWVITQMEKQWTKQSSTGMWRKVPMKNMTKATSELLKGTILYSFYCPKIRNFKYSLIIGFGA